MDDRTSVFLSSASIPLPCLSRIPIKLRRKVIIFLIAAKFINKYNNKERPETWPLFNYIIGVKTSR